jgi:transcriptional regulator with XRE-family HTH domain
MYFLINSGYCSKPTVASLWCLLAPRGNDPGGYWQMGLLGRSVQERREELGVGQADLAKRVGVTQQTISRWENGEIVPPPKRLTQLAAALDIDLDRLLGYAGYLPSSPAALSRSELLKAFYDLIPELSDEELCVAFDRAWSEIRRRVKPLPPVVPGGSGPVAT